MRLLLVVPTLSSYVAFLSDFVRVAISEGHEVHLATRIKLLDDRAVKSCKLDCNIPQFKLHQILLPRGANPVAACLAAK